jgi:hypothetical protein
MSLSSLLTEAAWHLYPVDGVDPSRLLVDYGGTTL